MEALIFEFCLWIFLKLHSLFIGLILFLVHEYMCGHG
jgi:hypothetical protein